MPRVVEMYVGDGLAEIREARRRAVAGPALVERALAGLLDVRGRRKIGLADLEVNDVLALRLERAGLCRTSNADSIPIRVIRSASFMTSVYRGHEAAGYGRLLRLLLVRIPVHHVAALARAVDRFADVEQSVLVVRLRPRPSPSPPSPEDPSRASPIPRDCPHLLFDLRGRELGRVTVDSLSWLLPGVTSLGRGDRRFAASASASALCSTTAHSASVFGAFSMIAVRSRTRATESQIATHWDRRCPS